MVGSAYYLGHNGVNVDGWMCPAAKVATAYAVLPRLLELHLVHYVWLLSQWRPQLCDFRIQPMGRGA